MKTLRNKFWALLLITSVAFLSCKKEDRFSPTTEANYKSKSAIDGRTVIGRNDWKITSYQVGDISGTNLFSQYFFKITEDGVIQAFTNNSVEEGTWLIAKKRVTIHFPFSRNLSKLNYEWEIINKTDYDIKLERINRAGERMLLSFQRIQRVGVLPTIGEVPTDPEDPILE